MASWRSASSAGGSCSCQRRAERDRAPPHAQPQEADQHQQHGRRQHAQHPAVRVQQRGDVVRAPEQADGAEEQHAQPEGGRVEDDDARHLRRLHPGRRVQPHAHDAARQGPQPDGVGQRVGHERRQQHRAAAHLGADVAQRGRVVAGERQVAEGGGQHGARDLGARRGDDRRQHVGVVHLDQQAPQRDADHRGQAQAHARRSARVAGAPTIRRDLPLRRRWRPAPEFRSFARPLACESAR